jgi:hypothetical protein
MKNSVYSPLVLIIFAFGADRAIAGPRVDGIARCALSDMAAYQAAPIVEETPTLAADALAADVDDFACGTDETLLVDACPAAAITTAQPMRAGFVVDMVRRATDAIHAFVRLPARYGIALFGGADLVPQPPKKAKKPRMLTLF